MKLNLASPTTRQVLNSLDMSVEDFVANNRKGSPILNEVGELTGSTLTSVM